MKRIVTLFVLFVAIVVSSTAIGQRTKYWKAGVATQTFTVVAADAAGTVRRGGPNVLICNGTQTTGGDEVQLAAAFNAARAVRGTVELVGKTFYPTKPTVYPGYGPSLTEINDDTAKITADPTIDTVPTSTNGISAVVHGIDDADWDAGTFTDWAIGDMIQLQAGVDEDTGSTIEQNVEDCFATIYDITDVDDATGITWTHATDTLTKTGLFANSSAGDAIYISGGDAGTVTGWYTLATVDPSGNSATLSVEIGGAADKANLVSEDALLITERFVNHSGDGAYDYSGVHIDKIIPALVVPSNIHVKGSGISGTQIVLANGSNCSLMMIWNDDATKRVYTGLSNLYLLGNYTKQGDLTYTNYDSRCHGLLINSESWDVHVNNVSIMNTKGDGLIVGQPWGLQWTGGWLEHCTGKQIFICDGNNASFTQVKCVQTGEATTGNNFALFVREGAAKLSWQGGMLNAEHNWAVYLKNAHSCKFVGAEIFGENATCAGGVYIDDDCTGTQIIGCEIDVDNTNTSAIGIDINNSQLNTISGCLFDITCPEPIEVDETGAGNWFQEGNSNVVGCTGLQLKHEIRSQRVFNPAGGATGTLSNYRIVQWNAVKPGEQVDDYVVANGTPCGMVVSGAMADDPDPSATGYIQTQGNNTYVPVDNDDALAVGDYLTVSDTDAGYLGKAWRPGDTIYGIARATTNGNGTATTVQGVLCFDPPLGVMSNTPATATATATADGLTTGLLRDSDHIVTVTSADADYIVTLPVPSVGRVIRIITTATGCELRTRATSNVTINNVDADGGVGDNELALAADSHFVCECISATEWIVRGFTNLGADLPPLVPDAI